MTILSAAEIWRDYETDGVPASEPHEPIKRDVKQWGLMLESMLAQLGLGYANKAALDADLAHAANALAMVYADPTPANNGVYVKAGVSGTGSWSRIGDLPDAVIQLTVTGGTGNAIVATAPSTPIAPGRHLYLLTPTANNTGATTIVVNGAAPVAIKNALNANLASGSLIIGNGALMYWSTDHYQLLVAAAIDGNAILADAQAAATAAAASATAAANTAASVAVTVGAFGISTYAAAVGMAIDSGVHFVKLYGRSNPLDGGEVYAKDMGMSDPSGPSRAKFQSADGRYWQFKTDFVRPEMFGEFGGASTSDPDNSVGLTQMFNFVNSNKTPKIIFTNGLWCLDSELPALACLTEIECRLGSSQPPILLKRYTTPGFNGVLRSEQYALRVKGATVLGISGTGGSGLSSILTSNSPNVGEAYINDTHISMGAFGNLSFYLDGDTNQTVGTTGYRTVYINNGNWFGANSGCSYFTGVHHLFANGLLCQTAGGTSSAAAVFTAVNASFKSDNLILNGALAGDVTITNWTRGVIMAADIANFTAAASVSDMRLYGSPTGTRSLSWTGASAIV